jgi:hypothetical protein
MGTIESNAFAPGHGYVGAKSKVDVIADILQAIKERRA